MTEEPRDVRPIKDARCLIFVGDSVTTDHISPAGDIAADSPAGKYLAERGVPKSMFNSYGSRRGNDRVMTRGTFANVRVKNKLAVDPATGNIREGWWTKDFSGKAPAGDAITPIFDAATRYKKAGTPLVVLAGKDYGMGSSRDWAAKGTNLLGVRAVIAQSYERIHRSNLVGMGVLPLQFAEGQSAESLALDGSETFDIDLPPHHRAAQHDQGQGHEARRQDRHLRNPLPRRHPRRSGVLPPRRHPPLRPPQDPQRERTAGVRPHDRSLTSQTDSTPRSDPQSSRPHPD